MYHMLKRKSAWAENYYYYRRLDKHIFTAYHFVFGGDCRMVSNGFDFFLSISESLFIFWPSVLIAISFLRWADIPCACSNHHFW